MNAPHLKYRLAQWLDTYYHDREERIRLFVFLTSTTLLTIFMLLHVTHLIGIENRVLHTLSWGMLLSTLCTVGLHLRRRLTLTQAFTLYAVVVQAMESLRMVYLAVTQLPNYELMVLGNQIGSYSILLYVTLGFVPRAPWYVTGMSMGSLYFVSYYREGCMDPQMVVLFTLLCLFTCVLAHISQRGLHHIQQEKNEYEGTQNLLLKAFRMSKDELIAYLQLCRTQENQQKTQQLFLRQLDEQSKHNLIIAIETLVKEQEAERSNLGARFPQLTETEREVARLIVAGKTLKEIALITHKTTSNIGTVRGNIRRKLGLQTTDDLTEVLRQP